MPTVSDAVDHAAPVDFKAGETPKGRAIVIKRAHGSLFSVRVEGGGKQPPEFAGLWTHTAAQDVVRAYVPPEVAELPQAVVTVVNDAATVADVAQDLGVSAVELQAALDTEPAVVEDVVAEQPAKKTIRLKGK